MRSVLRALLFFVVIYACYGAAMVVLHPRYIYPFSDTPFGDPTFEMRAIGAGGQAAVSVGAPDAPVILYFMGNVGALELFRPMLEHHAAAGRSVLAMGYPGGGGLPGAPSETLLKAQAIALFDAVETLVPGARGPVVAQGYSLGTGLAVHVAAERAVDGVVLSAPYDRMCDLMADRSGLPACAMPGVQTWDSAADAPPVAAPVLVLHGTADGLIPFEDGVRLAGRFDDVVLVPVEGAGHADLIRFPKYLEAIDDFIAALP